MHLNLERTALDRGLVLLPILTKIISNFLPALSIHIRQVATTYLLIYLLIILFQDFFQLRNIMEVTFNLIFIFSLLTCVTHKIWSLNFDDYNLIGSYPGQLVIPLIFYTFKLSINKIQKELFNNQDIRDNVEIVSYKLLEKLLLGLLAINSIDLYFGCFYFDKTSFFPEISANRTAIYFLLDNNLKQIMKFLGAASLVMSVLFIREIISVDSILLANIKSIQQKVSRVKDIFSLNKIGDIFLPELPEDHQHNSSRQNKLYLLAKNLLDDETSYYDLQPLSISTPYCQRYKELPQVHDLISDCFETDTHQHRTSQAEEQSILNTINTTLKSFQINALADRCIDGPTLTMAQLQLGEGTRINKVMSILEELKLNIGRPIRLSSSKAIPLYLEIPKERKSIITLKDLLITPKQQLSAVSTINIGVDMIGQKKTIILEKLPHLLISGTTGSGKSVAIHGIIMSLLHNIPAHLLKILMIDPKRTEMNSYNGIPNLLTDVITDIEKIPGALEWIIQEMNARFDLLTKHQVRNIVAFNEKMSSQNQLVLPYIFVIIDEFADLILKKNKSEEYLVELAQKSRAAGIHLIIATQRPSANVVTGLLKVNIPGRLAMRVSSKLDSRIVLDQAGAESLTGYGDALFQDGSGQPVRVQVPYVSDQEIIKVCNLLK